MPQSLANVLLHLIFSTKNRRPLIDENIEPELNAYLATVLKSFGCPAVVIGAAADHVHVLCNFSRTITIAKLIETSKSDSSAWIKTKGRHFDEFHWQSGYGAFSVSQSQVDALIRYISNQRAHHMKQTFQDEYRELLRKSRTAYDEKYVWN